jgi:hypothetical protein
MIKASSSVLGQYIFVFHDSVMITYYCLHFSYFLWLFFHLGMNVQIKFHAHTLTNVCNICTLHNNMQIPGKSQHDNEEHKDRSDYNMIYGM